MRSSSLSRVKRKSTTGPPEWIMFHNPKNRYETYSSKSFEEVLDRFNSERKNSSKVRPNQVDSLKTTAVAMCTRPWFCIEHAKYHEYIFVMTRGD